MKKLIIIVIVGFGLVILGILIGQSSTGTSTTTQEAKKPIDPALQAICSRESPYTLEPRFQRALSLIKERTDFNSGRSKSLLVGLFYPHIKNCLDVSYCPDNEMLGAEGLFFFSKEVSTKDKYKICISNSYSQADDLLTSVVLAHEITHAVQFANEKSGEVKPVGCIEKEAQAFSEEIFYYFSLTQEEATSLITRTDLSGFQTPQVQDLKNLVIRSATLQKSYNPETWPNAVETDMKNYVASIPFYQNQCAI